MPVQAPQLHPLAIQIKAPGHELDGAEAEPGALFVQHPVGQAAGAGPDEPDGQGIEEGGAPRSRGCTPFRVPTMGRLSSPLYRALLPAGLRISACRVQPMVSPTVEE